MFSLLFTLLTTGCDDESFEARQSAVIERSPHRFIFPATAPGDDPIERIVTVKNLGESELILAQITASFDDIASYQLDYRVFDITSETPADGEFLMGLDATGHHFPNTIVIARDHAVALKLRYVPDAEGAGGQVSMITNADPRRLSIPVEGGVAQGDIITNPSTLDFNRVSVNEHQTLNVRLTNVGTSVAMISQVFLNGSDEFTVSLNGEVVTGDPTLISSLADPDEDGLPGISPTNSADFSVTYAPTSIRSRPGELVFALKDAIQDRITVNLMASGVSPCINLIFPDSASSDPTRLDFRPTLTGTTALSEVIIESCGERALEVSQIAFEGSSALVLDTPQTSFTLPGVGHIRPTQGFHMQFSPTEAEVYEGLLVITSNDPVQPELRIPVVARGTVNACPEAVVSDDQISVRPLDIITLDASNSVDLDGPNGAPVSFEWVVVERPEGSAAHIVERFFNPLAPNDGGLEDDTSTPTAQFFVDLAGEYVFQLIVTDDLGFSAPSDACPHNEVHTSVNAIPDQDIHIELTWTTPSDPNETDNEGTDVDLHLRHPNGDRWFDSTYDCYFNNRFPDWGDRGPLNNPQLDLDDVNGAGPENINLDEPEHTDETTIPGPYVVGVDYYRSGGLFTSDFGESEATVNIYLGGALAETFTRTLYTRGNFWEVAGIIWTAQERRVDTIDRFYNTTP